MLVNLRLKNFPIPETEITGLSTGLLLEEFIGLLVFPAALSLKLAGWLLFGGGLFFIRLGGDCGWRDGDLQTG